MNRYAHIVLSFLITLVFFNYSFAQKNNLRFEHITSKDGLPENSVRVINQDYEGYLWFGTQMGLVKYDGYSMKIYQHNPYDSTSISHNQIRSIFEDKNGDLWVGTGSRGEGGLNKLNRSDDTFKRYLHIPNDSTSISSNNIDCIYEDHLGNLWVGTNVGLNLLNRKTNKFQRFPFRDKKYSEEVYQFIEKLRGSGKTLQSILKVGNNADLKKTITLPKKSSVLVVSMGESINDYGWLEDVEGKKVFESDVSESLLAGKNIRHRIQIWYDTLNPGTYKVRYISNSNHSYKNWHDQSHLDYKAADPDHPENWGIQVFNIDDVNIDISDLLNEYYLASVDRRIFDIIENQTNNSLLIGTSYPGIASFDIKRKSFIKDFSENIGSVSSFHQSRDGSILIASSRGVSKYIPEKGFITNIQPFPCFYIMEDKDRLIWTGSVGNGLASYDPRTDEFTRYRSDNSDNFSMSSERVWSIFEDRSGILWVGTWNFGLNKYNRFKWVFNHYGNKKYTSGPVIDRKISSIYVDNDIIWLGTNGTLIKYDRIKQIYQNYDMVSSITGHNLIGPIIKDEYHNLWFGVDGIGLVKFNINSHQSKFYSHNSQNINSISGNYILAILKDDGKLWVGTTQGLNRFNPETEVFERYQNVTDDTCSLSSNQLRAIFKDSHNNLWLGTNQGGLLNYDKEHNCFNKVLSDQETYHSILEDSNGNLWIGTYMNGLVCLNRDDYSYINYTTKDGLISNEIKAMLLDDNGCLWSSASGGLIRIDLETRTIKNFTEEDGFAIDNFSNYSCAKSTNGELFFGSESNGFISFYPENVKDNLIPPEVVISKISLFNQPDSSYTIKESFTQSNTVKFYHYQNDLRFEFAAIHFDNPAKNKYKFKLENFNDNWIDAGSQRNTVYTNLDPGEYVFRVIASNSDGIWNNEGASVRIIILPPWWATTWAYLLYALIISGIIYFTWKLQLKRIRNKHELEMTKFEAEKMHEVDELKSRFFANISHEFRTPLTLIFGPAKDVIEETNEPSTKKKVGIIKRNASRLYNLVNQLLDLSKLESGKMKLEANEQDIIPLLKGIFLSFTSFAERKKIELNFNTIEEKLYVYIDRDKVEKIINNLLSNAFKFTPEGGKIDFYIEKTIKGAEIRITDNGIGIPEERIDKIFDRFYQVDSSHTRQGEGTGIGLALTKELVELHKGKIKVESKEGEGTTVMVRLPLGKEHLKSEEIVEKEVQEAVTDTNEESDLIPEFENRKEKTDIDVLLDTDKPLLLIVEDNPDVRSYIIDHLDENYRIQEAVDGGDGLNQAVKHIPDLIISDVMMPKMDGFELCNKLKTDERTSHIPIIMLTAKATSKDKIEGYETGADDYIMKPFDATELKVRIRNLIEIRRNLQEKFGSDDYTIPKELNSIDGQFIMKALQVINEHLSEEEFSIEQFCLELGMSDVQNYRKIKALTGRSPSSFIRSIRLKKGKSMIEERRGTIAEIAYSVGFGSPSYFSKCFKEEYGYLPSEIIK